VRGGSALPLCAVVVVECGVAVVVGVIGVVGGVVPVVRVVPYAWDRRTRRGKALA